MVIEVSKEVQKEVNFKSGGDEIFVDHEEFNLLNDSLIHLIRNSIDHGIETIEKRKERNKEDFGTINILTKDINNTFELSRKNSLLVVTFSHVSCNKAKEASPSFLNRRSKVCS